jgi:hypothetical protein
MGESMGRVKMPRKENIEDYLVYIFGTITIISIDNCDIMNCTVVLDKYQQNDERYFNDMVPDNGNILVSIDNEKN